MRVDEVSKNREETFKVSKEWWIIKGPRASLIKVPLRKRERVGKSQPVAMDLKISTVV